MSPTPPPAVFPCTRVTTNRGDRIIARITRTKPEKNRFPAAASRTALSSSNDAPAQNAPVPVLRSTMTRAAGSRPAASIAFASFPSSAPGSELLLGCPNRTMAIFSRISSSTVPASSTEGDTGGWVTGPALIEEDDRIIFLNIRKCFPSKRIGRSAGRPERLIHGTCSRRRRRPRRGSRPARRVRSAGVPGRDHRAQGLDAGALPEAAHPDDVAARALRGGGHAARGELDHPRAVLAAEDRAARQGAGRSRPRALHLLRHRDPGRGPRRAAGPAPRGHRQVLQHLQLSHARLGRHGGDRPAGPRGPPRPTNRTRPRHPPGPPTPPGRGTR